MQDTFLGGCHSGFNNCLKFGNVNINYIRGKRTTDRWTLVRADRLPLEPRNGVLRKDNLLTLEVQLRENVKVGET